MYNFIFGQNALVVDYKGYQILLRPGQKCHCRSDRYDMWFTDGIITEIYKDSVVVTYGFGQYFGFSFSRGNSKTVKRDEIIKYLRFPNASLVRSAKSDLTSEEAANLLQKIQDDSDSD